MITGPCIDHGLRGDASGYGQRRTAGKHALVHRLAYAAHHGLDESRMGGVVMHLCDNPRCINPEHLRLGTHKLNAEDRENKGRGNHVAEAAHPQAKLATDAVARIRRRYTPRCKINGGAALAREFGVSQQQISRIVRGVRWAA